VEKKTSFFSTMFDLRTFLGCNRGKKSASEKAKEKQDDSDSDEYS